MACTICTMRFYVLDCDAQNDYYLLPDGRRYNILCWAIVISRPMDAVALTVSSAVRPMNINWKCKQQQCNEFCVNLLLIVWNPSRNIRLGVSSLFSSFRKSLHTNTTIREKNAYSKESRMCVRSISSGSDVWNMNTIGVGNRTDIHAGKFSIIF